MTEQQAVGDLIRKRLAEPWMSPTERLHNSPIREAARSNADRIAATLVDKAIAGDLEAVRIILDRVEGPLISSG